MSEELNKQLFEAVKKKGVKEAAEILKKGADINARDENGNTPLFYAAAPFGGDLEYVKFLVEQGADIKVINKKGQNVIEYGGAAVSSALENNQFQAIVEYLKNQ